MDEETVTDTDTTTDTDADECSGVDPDTDTASDEDTKRAVADEHRDVESLHAPAFSDEDFWLSTKKGSGSHTRKTAWVVENSRSPANDGRSHTRTTFYGSDCDAPGPSQKHREPSKRRTWTELAKWNDGMYSDKSRGSQNFWADNQRWVDIIADMVGATEHQCSETKRVIEALSFGQYKAAHIQMETLILAILSVFVDREIEIRPDEQPADAIDRRMIERDGTAQLIEDLDIERSDIVEAKRMLMENDEQVFSSTAHG